MSGWIQNKTNFILYVTWKRFCRFWKWCMRRYFTLEFVWYGFYRYVYLCFIVRSRQLLRLCGVEFCDCYLVVIWKEFGTKKLCRKSGHLIFSIFQDGGCWRGGEKHHKDPQFWRTSQYSQLCPQNSNQNIKIPERAGGCTSNSDIYQARNMEGHWTCEIWAFRRCVAEIFTLPGY